MTAMRICEYLWLVFLVVWMLYAIRTKPVQTREGVSSRLSYTVLTVVGHTSCSAAMCRNAG